jgi:hypothetical protein
MKINHWIVVTVGSVLTTIAFAKLPAPVSNDEQKAKVEEAKAKAADAAKKSAADDLRYQDRAADRYFREMKAAGKTPTAPQWVTPPAAAPATVPATTPAAPAKAAGEPAKKV